MRSHRWTSRRRVVSGALTLLFACLSSSCAEKATVAGPSLQAGAAQLGVAVALGALAADGDITAVHVIAQYTSPANVVTTLADQSVPYAQGETRDIALTLDIAQCLRDYPNATSSTTPACPVQVTVEVLALAHVLARDVLPIVLVRAGQSTSTPALAARGASSIKLSYNSSTTVPSPVVLVTGATGSLAAVALDAAGATIAGRTIVWNSTAPAVATVSASGVVTAVSVGTATVTATTGTGGAQVQATATISVVAPIPVTVSLAPATAALAVGGTQSLTPTVRDGAGVAIVPLPLLTWTSSAPSIASVSSSGVATAVAAGTAVISATTANGIVGTASITVAAVPASMTLAPSTVALSVSGTQSLTPTVRDAAGTVISPLPALTWTSDNAAVATVSTSGVVTAVATGNAVITARTTNGISATATVAVSPLPASISLAPATSTLSAGATQQLTPTVRDGGGATITPTPTLTWTSDAPSVATVSTSGLVTTIALGTATITARTTNGLSATATVTVSQVAATIALSPSSATLAVAATQALTALVKDAAGTTISPTPALTWQTSAATIATVSTSGVVTGVSVGSATITARTANNVSATATITVAPTGTFAGRVYDIESNTGIANAAVTFSTGGVTIRTVNTDGAGNYTSGTITGTAIDLRATAAGYVAADVRGVAVNGAVTLEALPLAKTATGNGSITGTVLNATTNQPVLTGATLEVYAGVNVTTGTPAATVTTTAQTATFTIPGLPAGTYTLVGRATGYSVASRTVVSLGAQRTVGAQNIFLSPSATVGALRIVLTWGSTPADLDAHITGPVAPSGSFWVYFASPGSCTGSPFTCLDVDVVTGNGPETVTIAQRVNGRYVFSVHNYSADGNNVQDASLSRSNARVDVYSAAGLVRTFNVPAQSGTLWTVFDWDGTTIRAINTINGAAPPGVSSGLQALFAPFPLPSKASKAAASRP